jgi:fructose/tagatose bisphosphate aldolase
MSMDFASGAVVGLIGGAAMAVSDLRLAALGRIRQVLTMRLDIFNLYELMGEVEDAMRAAVEAHIRLFGSEGKAA